jgi:hypothetical protein
MKTKKAERNLETKSVMNIVEAIIDKKTDPDELVQLVYGNTANKKSRKLREALSGNTKEHFRSGLGTCLLSCKS